MKCKFIAPAPGADHLPANAEGDQLQPGDRRRLSVADRSAARLAGCRCRSPAGIICQCLTRPPAELLPGAVAGSLPLKRISCQHLDP